MTEPRQGVKLSDRSEHRVREYIRRARTGDRLEAFSGQLARTDPAALAWGRAQVAAGTARKGC